MTAKLGSQEFITQALSQVETPDTEQRVDPAELEAMKKLAIAVGGPERLEGTRENSATAQLHKELARAERRDGSIRVSTSTQRLGQTNQSRMPVSGSRFRMRRDWDPEEEPPK